MRKSGSPGKAPAVERVMPTSESFTGCCVIVSARIQERERRRVDRSRGLPVRERRTERAQKRPFRTVIRQTRRDENVRRDAVQTRRAVALARALIGKEEESFIPPDRPAECAAED